MSGLRASQVLKCSVCGEGVAKGGLLLHRVTVETLALDPGAIQRQIGMETYFQGAVGLARVFSDEVVAQTVDSTEHLVCHKCYLETSLPELEGSSEERACRICGCTETTPCVDDRGFPCSWVESDLCSACDDKEAA